MKYDIYKSKQYLNTHNNNNNNNEIKSVEFYKIKTCENMHS